MSERSFWSRVNPNHVTILRIALVPVLCYFIYTSHLLVAFLMAVPLAISDKIDGWLARKYKKVSELGKMLDPVSDKCYICLPLVFLVIRQKPGSYLAPLGVIICLIICIELGLAAISLAKYFKIITGRKTGANAWGKTKMGLEIGAVLGALLAQFLFELQTDWSVWLADRLFFTVLLVMATAIAFGYLSIRGHLTIRE